MAVLDREKIKSAFPWLADAVHYAKKRKTELSSLKRHLSRKQFQKDNQKDNHGIIKVVIICQYIPAWSKNKQLYEALKNDLRFEVKLLCIPNRVSANKLINPDDMSNDTYDYFSEHGYKEALNALVGKYKWFDLKHYRPDYVLYNRFDRPMPMEYTSSVVSAYAKVIYIHYGSALLKSDEYTMDKNFIANTSCFFAESTGIKNVFENWNAILCRLHLTHAFSCGIPAIENAYKAKNDDSPAWDFSKNKFRVIYTPRWTFDKTWGGSTFMKYKDTFVRIADDNPDIDVLLRPHPLMFDNFINTGVMSAKEVDEYREECKKRENLSLDKEKEYQASFWNSSVLVCDFSSMIIEYFITGHPVVYLTYDAKINYTDQMKKVLNSSYIVNGEEELIRVLEQLKNGNDPKAELRRQVIEEEFASSINASEKMKQVLIDNYNN